MLPANNTQRRLLIAQDRYEIYVVISTFSDVYVDYVCGRSRSGNVNSFLRMRDFGPFSVNVREDMAILGKVLLAFSIQGGLYS
jgi:hypothetical protein